jgi:hypothetical protein
MDLQLYQFKMELQAIKHHIQEIMKSLENLEKLIRDVPDG